MRKLYTLTAVLLMFLGSLNASPTLTIIQDILYKADGTRFNGVLEIHWTNFQAGDSSVVATQSLTVQVVNGVLKVQLVPTTNASPGANYQVNYSSAGKFQFSETWAVPPSTTALRVKDVRVGTGTTVGTGTGTGTTSGNLGISDISGLTNELLLRIMRGAGFTPGRAAVINTSGQIDGAVGNPSDCVRVDGSSAPCGTSVGSGTTLLYQETPQGTINGSNLVFTLANAPNPASSLQLYRNGLLLTQGTAYDYSLSGNTVTFVAYNTPQVGDTIQAVYLHTSAASITAGNLTSSNTPQVLCNGAGVLTSSTSPVAIGTCRIAANALVAGDRVEIKFGYLHLGNATTASTNITWGGTTLLARGMNASDLAVSGESTVLVATDGTLQHFTSSAGPGSIVPVVTAGTVLGNIQSINTLTFTASIGASSNTDNVVLRYYTVTRYPAQ